MRPYLPCVIALLYPACLVADDNGNGNGNGKEVKPRKPPRTLLEWKAGKEPEKEENGNGNGEEPEPLATDRPDFTEASSTVGRGRIQLESGYTYTRDRADGATTNSHSYPEALLRVGLFAEWFELRMGQNFGNSQTPGQQGDNGAEDLYLGVKLYLVEQKECLPEMALVVQSDIPTGGDDFSAGQMLPGVNLLYGWDVIPDRLTLGGSTQANRAQDDADQYYVEFAQSATMGLRFTKKLASYIEYYGLYPSGAADPDTLAEHYFDGGFTWRLNNDVQFDIRAGVGLNRHADDFFAGAGFAIRF